jgi:DNA-binding transcriptional LysR family regulator
MPLSIRQLRFFVALSQTGNFSRAAEAMAVSQPALSAAIRQIETLLDTRLFDRTTHSVVPTQAGRALLPHAWRLLTTADNAFADMTSVLRNSRATVRIGAIPSALPATAQIVARIDEDAQGVNLHLADGTSDTLIAELRRGALDMAVCVASLIDEGWFPPPDRGRHDPRALAQPPAGRRAIVALERAGGDGSGPFQQRQHRRNQRLGHAREQYRPLAPLPGGSHGIAVRSGAQRAGRRGHAPALCAGPRSCGAGGDPAGRTFDPPQGGAAGRRASGR